MDVNGNRKLIRITTVPISLRSLLKGQLRYMSSHFEVIGISSDGPDLYDVSENEGIRVIPVEMERPVSLFKDIKSVYKLYKVFRREKPMIVHTHTPKAGMAGMMAGWLAGVPVRMHTVAGLPLMEATGGKRRVLDIIEKITYKCAHKVYPNSSGLCNFILEQKYCPSHKLKVIANGSSNGINTDFFTPDLYSGQDNAELRKTLNIKEDDFVFVFVGRLVKDKGINELVHAFSQLSKNHPDAKLLLVGPYEKGVNLLEKETEAEINSNPSIISVGHQKDVRPYLAVSDALIFPSYREGFPNVVMQAGAMGLPSIVTDINGCNEIIVEGENGVIIPAKDAKSVYDKMEQFLSDRSLVEKLAQNARHMIVSRYEQRVVWESILEEYKSLTAAIKS